MRSIFHHTSVAVRSRTFRVLTVAAAAGATPLLGTGSAEAQVQAEWMVPVSGAWTDPSNWSTDPHYPHNGMPAGTSYDVLIGATGAPYTVSTAQPLVLDSLRLTSPDATLDYTGQTIALGAGSLHVGNGAQMLLGSADVTTGGNVLLGNGGHLGARRMIGSGISADWTFTNGATADLGEANLAAGSIAIMGGASVLFSRVYAGIGAGNVGSILISGADTVVRGESIWHIGGTFGAATMRVTDGARFMPGFTSLGAIVGVGAENGTGTLHISGGANFVPVHLEVGYLPSSAPGPGTGTVIIDDPDTIVNPRYWLIVGSPGGGAGTVILNAGTLHVGQQGAQPQSIVHSTGTVLVNGGVFVSHGIVTRLDGLVRISGTGTMLGGFAQINGRLEVEREWDVVGQIVVQNGGLIQAGQTLGVRGATTLHLTTGGNISAPALALSDGGRLRFHPTAPPALRTGALTIDVASSSWLDLTSRNAIIDYDATTSSPIDDVKSWIASGYNQGSWNGVGIHSTVAAANPGFALGYAEASGIFTSFPATFAGQEVDDTAVLIAYTRYGDANLDRIVNLQDFNRLAANFGATDAAWSQGDFNFDGIVNLVDFNLLAGNFGLSAAGPAVKPEDWAALASAVPEPGVLGLALLTPALLPRRRRA